MKRLFIIANWKSNKTIQETEEWLHEFDKKLKTDNINIENKEIIVCPSFTLFEHAHYCSENLKLPVKFGAQDISAFGEGAYTGEVNGRQLKEVANYVIVGHSERRQNFGEDEEMIVQKVEQAKRFSLTPIVCISNINQIGNCLPAGKAGKLEIGNSSLLVAYEPLFAIGSGSPDTPENANDMAEKIKKVMGSVPVLYGGSITSNNAKNFTSMPQIDGLLIGGASLGPLEFAQILKNV